MEDKGITLAQVEDKGITLAQVEDKDIILAQVEGKDITLEEQGDKEGPMGAVDITQDGLGVAAKVVPMRVVTPWSKESASWRERKRDWRPNEDPAPPPPPLPTLAEESVAPDTTEL